MSTKTPRIGALLRANPRSCKYGAPLGRSNVFADDYAGRLYLQRVPFIDGDYSPDGTYWGGGRGTLPLWAMFSPGFEVLCFYRAPDRMTAAREFDAEHGGARRAALAAAKPATVPVIFRATLPKRYGGAPLPVEITAVFPTIPGTNDEKTCTCYARIGQHGTCSREWYAYETRAATPEEYAPLLAELTRLYERDIAGEGAARLRIVKRWHRSYDAERLAELEAPNA